MVTLRRITRSIPPTAPPIIGPIDECDFGVSGGKTSVEDGIGLIGNTMRTT